MDFVPKDNRLDFRETRKRNQDENQKIRAPNWLAYVCRRKGPVCRDVHCFQKIKNGKLPQVHQAREHIQKLSDETFHLNLRQTKRDDRRGVGKTDLGKSEGKGV